MQKTIRFLDRLTDCVPAVPSPTPETAESVATALNRRLPPDLLQTERKNKEETDDEKKRHAP